MPRCPGCHEEIDQLDVVAKETTWHTFFLMPGTGEPYWEETDRALDEFEGFYCPLCDVKLFETEEEAVAFLKEAGE